MSRGNGASVSRGRNALLVVGMIAVFAMSLCCALVNYVITGGEVGPGGVGPSAKPNTSGIKEFSYSSSVSLSLDGNYAYRIEADASGNATFYYKSLRLDEDEVLSRSVSKETMEALEAICRDCHVAEWNGYDRYNPNVLDGGGFSLRIGFSDGETLYASGSNAWPDGFGQFEGKIQELLRPYADQALADYRSRIIDTGIQGKLESMMVSFTQKGISGSDEYSVFITDPEVRNHNIDVKVDSKGEFFEPGRHRYYSKLPVEAIDFPAFQSLIDKYNVISWYDWDESSEDYANSEWFQVSFHFDDGLVLSAMGTRHPQNYREFRGEFLQLLADTISRAEKDYGLVEYSATN